MWINFLESSVLHLENISKSFGEVKSLLHVDFEIFPGEVVGLLGDNGAGKSTLIKIMNGYYPPDDSGKIYWKNKDISRLSVYQRKELGIETVYQERALAEQQSIWRNIFMGREITQNGFLKIRYMQEETDRLMKEIGFTGKSVTSKKIINTMSGGERQGIAIARALYFQAELIILDEPTMGLSLSETQKVLEFVRTIKQSGKSCVFIDHNIFHVFPIADRIVVLDRGQIAGQFLKGEITLEELTEKLYHVAKTGIMQ